MIIDETVEMTVCSSNAKYWKDKGYHIPKVGGRAGCNGTGTIQVRVSDLSKNSNVRVRCRCDSCGGLFDNRFSRNTDTCYSCFNSKRMKGNILGRAHKGKSLPHMQGENHPRWNPNKREFETYSRKVRYLTEKTYRENKHIINPHNRPRTRCGVKGGFQLDHIVTVAYGFENEMKPEELAEVNNLRMISWEKNSARPKISER